MRDVIGNVVPPNYYCDILFGQQLSWPIVVTLRHCQSHGLFGKRVAYTIELLDKGQLTPEEIFVHMAVHMQMSKFACKSVLRCLEASLDICAFFAGPYPTASVQGLLERSFVFAAHGSFPLLDFIEL
jgi:hypothetical protein